MNQAFELNRIKKVLAHLGKGEEETGPDWGADKAEWISGTPKVYKENRIANIPHRGRT